MTITFTHSKIEPLHLLMPLSASCSTAATIGVIIILLSLVGSSSAILTNIAYAQTTLFSPTKDKNNNAAANPTHISSSTSQLQPSQPKLHLVRITSPTKGQPVPVGKDLIISGTSVDNATASDCKVSVKVNFVSPYHDAVPTGSRGVNDYSKWTFTLTPAYTTIKPGQNKIISKLSCADNPSLEYKTTVNVTGIAAAMVPSTTAAAINSQQQQQISSTTSATPPPIKAAFNSTTKKAANPTITDSVIAAPPPSHTTTTAYSGSANNNYTAINSQQQQISSTVSKWLSTTAATPPPIKGTAFNSTTKKAANPTTADSVIAAAPSHTTTTAYSGSPNNNYNNDSHYHYLKALSASVRLGKSSIHQGDKQTITVKATDTDSTNPIAAASVSGTITSPDGLTKKFEDTTDYNGKASYSWKVSYNGDAIGKYKLVVKVFAPGFENYIVSKTFNVSPIPVTTTSISNDNDNNNRPISSTSDNNNNNNSPPLLTTTVPNYNFIPSSPTVTLHDNTISTTDGNSDSTNSYGHTHNNNQLHSLTLPPISDNTSPTFSIKHRHNDNHRNHTYHSSTSSSMGGEEEKNADINSNNRHISNSIDDNSIIKDTHRKKDTREGNSLGIHVGSLSNTEPSSFNLHSYGSHHIKTHSIRGESFSSSDSTGATATAGNARAHAGSDGVSVSVGGINLHIP
ncbi:MAG TPA: hypothetical protein VFJ51_11000 [Nitrososphaeraceae archaeon]|nr:hypothetical protein [Nitrososphaeraceae archaeon]